MSQTIRASSVSGRKGPALRKSSAGREIIDGLREAIELAKGNNPPKSIATIKKIKIPSPPRHYDADSVHRVRTSLGISQAVFASLIGASLPLVKAWERGVRTPSPMASRLLDEISDQPERWKVRTTVERVPA